MKNTLWGIVCLLGFLYVAGAVGALENDAISIGQGILHSIIGLAVFAGSAYAGGFMDE